MTDYRFERAARRRRTTAWTLTILLHLLLLAGITLSSALDWREQLPATVQQWLGMDDQPADAADNFSDGEVPRP